MSQEPHLAKSFYMVCYDLRGHGQSSKPENPEDYTSKLMADDFVAVAETFGLSNPVFLGWQVVDTVPGIASSPQYLGAPEEP
ncbi:hypothetical protein C8J56DRAFT_1039495 [Mycena floridula]|nr:hypothetical protein C8J56DRAFT_1039495 [Mycena floridula]